MELSQSFVQRKQNAQMLASQYTTSKRIGEIFSVTAYVIFFCLNAYNIQQRLELSSVWVLIVACVWSMVLADLFSGLVHWGADTWGTLETPFVGKTFIRSFREHHVDPYRITHHDIIETNGDNCMTTIVPLVLLSFVKIREGSNGDLFIVSFLMLLCLWVSLTNQIHKWAHTRKPNRIIKFFQDINFVLSRKDHQVHHHTPFDRYYCITTGWLNPLLGSIAFWKRVENLIEATTNEKPRKDDAFWTVQGGTVSSSDDEGEEETKKEDHVAKENNMEVAPYQQAE